MNDWKVDIRLNAWEIIGIISVVGFWIAVVVDSCRGAP